METIFDFNMTADERAALLAEGETKEFYLSYMDQDSAWLDIAYLMLKRGNGFAAKLYISKTSPQTQQSFYQTISHP